MKGYSLYKNIENNNKYIAHIYDYENANKIIEEIKSKGFIVEDDDYEGRCITLWLTKVN